MLALDLVTMGWWLRGLETWAILGEDKDEKEQDDREDWDKEELLEELLEPEVEEDDRLEKWVGTGPEEELLEGTDEQGKERTRIDGTIEDWTGE